MGFINKYRNIKTSVDGFKFDSKKEANRYAELKILVRAKIITNLTLQPEFTLLPAFTDSQGNKHRAIVYIADFSYIEKDTFLPIVEDVKGMMTDVYKLKKKLFLSKYTQYKFIES